MHQTRVLKKAVRYCRSLDGPHSRSETRLDKYCLRRFHTVRMYYWTSWRSTANER